MDERRRTAGAWDKVAWDAFAGPDEYRPADVPVAFAKLFQASSERDGERGYWAVHDAVGHNHSGVMYPASVAAVEPLLSIAVGANEFAARWALEVLIDHVVSFGTLEQFSTVDGGDGRPLDVRGEVVRIARKRVADIAQIARQSPSRDVARSARELLDALHRN